MNMGMWLTMTNPHVEYFKKYPDTFGSHMFDNVSTLPILVFSAIYDLNLQVGSVFLDKR